MYRDVVQWSKIRNRILVKGISRRQVVRETGISSKTVSKMLVHTHPQLPAPKKKLFETWTVHRLDPTDAPEKRDLTASRKTFHSRHLPEYPR